MSLIEGNFNLLFGDDEGKRLLKIDTGLRVVDEPLESQTDSQSAPTTVDDVKVHFEQLDLAGAEGREASSEPVPPSGPNNTVPASHDGTFCPLVAISRFPYVHIRGDLMQPVASEFFDKGQFWDRDWDIYYIHAPPRLGGRPILLAPASQVRDLLREINTAFDCTLSLPSEEERGLVLRFHRDEFPQPTYLGHAASRSAKDSLESAIPTRPNYQARTGDMDQQFLAFEKMMEAACVAAKSKSKSRAKKQRLPIQRELDVGEAIKRAQSYLGLRSHDSCEELIDCKWDEKKLADLDAETPLLKTDQPAPHPFCGEPVFISVDVESNERCHTQVTEVGISTLDTRDLVGMAPGPRGEHWQSRIRSRHLRVEEYGHIVNQLYVRGCPDKFEFGTSEWIPAGSLASTVQAALSQPSSPDAPEECLRPLVLVGHSLVSDIQYFQLLNVRIKDETSGASNFADLLDTAEFFRMIRGETEQRSLGGILGELGITGWNLHNAGNDARYTMQALVAMLLEHSIAQTSQLN